MAILKTVEDLDAYRKARIFRCEIARFAKTLPKEEAFRLKDQMLRASRSVTANIAEGFGRHHHQENSQFCRLARGSLVEMHDHLNCALDEGYLDEDRHTTLRILMEDVLHVLNGYINYLQRCAVSGVPRNGGTMHIDRSSMSVESNKSKSGNEQPAPPVGKIQ